MDTIRKCSARKAPSADSATRLNGTKSTHNRGLINRHQDRGLLSEAYSTPVADFLISGPRTLFSPHPIRTASPQQCSEHCTFLFGRGRRRYVGPTLSRLSQILRASRLRSATRVAPRAPWMSSVRR